MSTALTTTTALTPERFANPLQQIRSVMGQPAVRRSLPMALMIGLIGAAALAWMALSTPTQKTLFTGLPDADKAAVTAALDQANIKSRVDEGTGALTVGEEDYSKARMLLAGQGLPKAAPGGYAILDSLPMGVSRAVEGERLRQARETELAKSIEEIDAVADARVHLAMPESTVFVRDNAAPSASVILKLQGGRSLSDAQVQSIVNLVASSVPGMKPESVTIVDQLGALLSQPGGAGDPAGDQRLEVQRKVEEKYRTQLTQLLTPLVGAGNFHRGGAGRRQPRRDAGDARKLRQAGRAARRDGQLDGQPEGCERARRHSRCAEQHAAAREHAADAAGGDRYASGAPAAAQPVAGGACARCDEAVRPVPARLRPRQGGVGDPQRAGQHQAAVGRGAAARSRQDPPHRDGDRPDHRSGEERGRLRSERATTTSP